MEATAPMFVMHIMDKLAVDGSKIHGPARQVSYRARCYDPNVCRVMMVNLREAGPAVEVLEDAGVSTVSLNRRKADPRTLIDLIRLIRRHRPDVLHLAGYEAWTFGRLAGRLCGVPCVAQEHFIDQRVPLPQRIVDRLLSGSQAHVLAVSEGVRDFVREQRAVRGPVQIILNGVPLDDARPPVPGDRLAAREQLGIDASDQVVVVVGRLAEMKGHRFLLDAVAGLRDTHPQLRLLVVGEGPLRSPLEQQVDRLGLGDVVEFCGYQSKVMRYLRAADVSVIASIFGEGFPGVAVETFLAGTPLVISDLPNYRGGFFVDQANCLMVPPRDAKALREAIARLLDEPEFARRLSEAAFASLKACDIREISKQYVQVYAQVLGRAAASPAIDPVPTGQPVPTTEPAPADAAARGSA